MLICMTSIANLSERASNLKQLRAPKWTYGPACCICSISCRFFILWYVDCKFSTSCICIHSRFLRCFFKVYPIRVPGIENRIPRIKENYHRVPRITENRVPTSPYILPNIFLKKPWYAVRGRPGVGNLLLTVCQHMVLNLSVCQQQAHFYTSQDQYTFCVNHNKIVM